ncbi:MAG: SCP2 sterol-binding domain-containing protein [Methanomassiliicoccus sp.]|nr:SCP2 sterol-binding domain-containing protein [Methanomassiliicoccus sp.]
MTVEPQLQELIAKFNDKVEKDEKIRNELKGVDRKVLIDLESEKYNFHLRNERVNDFQTGEIADPDITILSDPATMEGLISGKIKPMKAVALRKLKLKGSIDDMLRLRSLF